MNRFSPPNAQVADLGFVPARWPGYLVATMALLQFAVIALFSRLYFELVRTGVVSALVALLSIVACILLYVAATRFAFRPTNGKYGFLLAAATLGWSASAWSLRYLWGYPFLFGAVVAVAGWWLVRANQVNALPPSSAG